MLYLYKVTPSVVTFLNNGKPVLHPSTIKKKMGLGLFFSHFYVNNLQKKNILQGTWLIIVHLTYSFPYSL